jgi:hypothetical protein
VTPVKKQQLKADRENKAAVTKRSVKTSGIEDNNAVEKVEN